MDTVSAALILAVAGGAGGAVGDQAWRGLVSLVHRPARDSSAPESGADQLVRLRQQPDDADSAAQLGHVLTARAAADDTFRAALETWSLDARRLYPPPRLGPTNTVSGGVFHGPVIQAGGSVHLSERIPPPTPPGP